MRRAAIAAALGSDVIAMAPVAGGDISAAFRVSLADGRVVFVKAHDNSGNSPTRDDAPDDTAHTSQRGMFAAEAAGLEWLRPSPLTVPRVLAVGDTWLALEWLELDGRPDLGKLGRGLAALHRLSAPSFGLAKPNYLATLVQDNTPEPDWPTFYVERRLRPLCRRAHLNLDGALDTLRDRPALFGPPEPPARLHGDLWWGNVASSEGSPVVFDPAVYGGHREVDLAMLALFGGLPDALVSAYEEVWPLATGWRERVVLHQLYPLAAHACLFGGGYGSQVKSTLSRYVGKP